MLQATATVVAPGSLASAFGKQIGASTEAARSLPLLTTLGGVSVSMMDSAKVLRLFASTFTEILDRRLSSSRRRLHEFPASRTEQAFRQVVSRIGIDNAGIITAAMIN